jgi:DNA-binding NarL/FixJ family response regulator
MTQIKVMFSSRPKLLAEVMQNLIGRQPDMKVVGEVIDPIELIFALRVIPADVVIITPVKTNGEPRICSQLLEEHPQLKILILTKESKAVYLFQSGLKKKCIENPSEQIIIDIIRRSQFSNQG